MSKTTAKLSEEKNIETTVALIV